MLQRDYGAAEVSFDEFLKRYPQDSLAGMGLVEEDYAQMVSSNCR